MDLQVGRINKVSTGQRFLSLADLDARIIRLEAIVAEQEAEIEEINSALTGLDEEIEAVVKSVNDILKKLEMHNKYGHQKGQHQVVRNNN